MTTSTWRPARRSASVSPTQMMVRRPALSAAPALARTSASVSCWSARRSLWPTMTQPGARLLQHADRDAAGMGAAVMSVAVLRADHDRAAGPGPGCREQGEGRTDGDVDAARLPRGRGDRAEFGERGQAAVHFPVAGDELAAKLHGTCFRCRVIGPPYPPRHGYERPGPFVPEHSCPPPSAPSMTRANPLCQDPHGPQETP